MLGGNAGQKRNDDDRDESEKPEDNHQRDATLGADKNSRSAHRRCNAVREASEAGLCILLKGFRS
jgi:hypothetical protein